MTKLLRGEHYPECAEKVSFAEKSHFDNETGYSR